MTLPKISVIITAHDRKNYILECLKSALDQTIERNLYEIIVVKNFDDPYIDDFINNNGIINVKTNNDAIGEKFLLGIEHSSGDILCILNDDDLFTKNKLEYILYLFNENKNLIYYHNSFIKIGEHGEIQDNNVELKRFTINTRSIDKRELKTALSGLNTFNDSCASFKRKVLLDYKSMIVNIKANQDTILFLLSCKLDGILIGDNEKLTRFRVHVSTSTFYIANQEENIKKFNNLINRRLNSYRFILPLFIKTDILYNYVYCNYRSNILQSFIFEDLNRSEVLYESLKFIKCLPRSSFKTRFLLIAIMFIKILNKNIIYKYISKLIFRYY
jgi:glycosyltransferase involved in cell wall biosynthesis